jgi:CRISPR-associated Csx14 family protein
MAESILVATLGTEPQVVTLALDALLGKEVQISRVVVVHTLPDTEPIRSSLADLRQEFLTRRYYGDQVLFVPHLLAGASGPLVDVITAQEIDDAFRSMYTLLRQFKLSGYHIHLSIAGGRKTMTLFAMAAAQILFDARDAVWHVVSAPHLLHTRQLHAAHPKDVTLVPVPVVHWGHLRPEDRTRQQIFMQEVLTPAEREVVQLLVNEGLSNAAIAERLSKSSKTVSHQLTSTYAKLADFYQLPEPPDRTMLLVLLGRSS